MVVKPMVDAYDQYIPYPQYLKLLLRATDGTSTGAKDFSGYGRIVTANGNYQGTTSQRKFNPYSMSFDGVTDYVYVSDSSAFTFASDLTISFWVRSLSTQPGTLNYGIVGTNSYTTSGISLLDDGTKWYIMSNSSAVINGSRPTADQWHHIAMIRQGSSFKLYLDGTQTGSTWTTSSTLTGTGFIVASRFGNLDCNIAGQFDEVAVWNGIAIPISQLYPQRKPFSFRRA